MNALHVWEGRGRPDGPSDHLRGGPAGAAPSTVSRSRRACTTAASMR
jgi:hypothetical protein